jgi:hypothetical protein
LEERSATSVTNDTPEANLREFPVQPGGSIFRLALRRTVA